MGKTSAVLFILLGLAASTCAANLLVNGDFETGNTSGWTQFVFGESSPVDVTAVSDPVHGGSYAAKIDATGGREGGIQQSFAAVVNKNYRVTFWYKGSSLYWARDRRGGTDPGGVGWNGLPDAADWTEVTYEFEALDPLCTVFFDVWDAVAYLDDITCEQFIRQEGIIEGTVTDSASGNPIKGVAVATDTGGFSATTDDSGFYQMTVVPVGTYTLQFRRWNYQDLDVPNVQVQPEQTTTQNAQMILKPTGGVGGTVTKATGGAMEGARCWLSTPEVMADATDSAGDYEITGVPVGTYTLTCRKPGYVAQTREIAIEEGVTKDEDFALEWRVIPPGNRVVNGGFETGSMDPWVEWCGTHFTAHQDYDPNCNYGDTFVMEGGAGSTHPIVVSGEGTGGSYAVKAGIYGDAPEVPAWGCTGGVCQQFYVEPGKYYQVTASFKGYTTIPANVSTFSTGVGLVDRAFDPGVYENSETQPPPNVDDLFRMVSSNSNATQMLQNIPEPERWWHNLMSLRSTEYHSLADWDWTPISEWLAPRNYLAGDVRRATDDVMTVVLWTSAINWEWVGHEVALFDDVQVVEVAGPGGIRLGDISKVDITAPYEDFPEVTPQVEVSITDANPKVVTGRFNDPANLTSYYCYIEELDRSAGIRVELPDLNAVQIGEKIALTGTLGATAFVSMEPYVYRLMERTITPYAGTVQVISSANEVPAPVQVVLRNVSAKFPYLDPFADSYAPGNTGLLASVTGRATAFYESNNVIWLLIDDQSGKLVWLRNVPYDEAPDPENSEGYGFVGKYVTGTGVIGIGPTIPGPDPAMVVQIREERILEDFEVLQ